MRKIVLSLFLITFFPAILPAQAASDKDKPYGGTLVWGVSYKPTIINPILTTQSVSAPLGELIFNALIRWNSKGDIEPDLAERWDVSTDGLVYTFYLRKGVRFHDGVECTSQDVKFTFDKIIDPQVNSPFRSLFNLVGEFKAVDKYTFQVVLTKPFPSFIYRLIRYIIPEHLLKDVDLENAPFNFKPIGTGPFRFKEWKKDNQITIEYNLDYYEGRPYLDKIMVRTYADSRGLWTALMRQEVDLALFIEREDYEIIKNDPAFKAYAFPFDSYYAVVYNLEDPILSDQRIRQAIAYGIERKSLIEKIGFGYGLECNGPFYPGSVGFNPGVQAIEFNPDKAIALLSEAGWSDVDKDGILEKDGEKLEIRMLVDKRSDVYRKMAMLLRQQLSEIGIKLTVQWYSDESVLSKEFLEQNKSQAQLKLLFAGVALDQIEADWSIQGAARVDNLWIYRNPEVERYLTLAKTAQDKKKREWIYQEIHRFIYTDQPACFLYFPFCFHAVSSRFENVDGLFTLTMPHHSMREWAIKPRFSDKKGRR